MRPTVGMFGVLARVNTVSTEKCYACMALLKRHIRPPGDTRLCDAKRNFRPLKVNLENKQIRVPTYGHYEICVLVR